MVAASTPRLSVESRILNVAGKRLTAERIKKKSYKFNFKGLI